MTMKVSYELRFPVVGIREILRLMTWVGRYEVKEL